MGGNYQKNAKIIHEICTKEELARYFDDPDVRNDQGHIVNVVLTRIAITLHDNPTLAFGSYTSDDIHQFCWEWCMENLRAGKYNSRTSLYGYLEKVCKNKVKKLRRDKQWRTDISDQNACRQCKHRDTCERKITYADLDTMYLRQAVTDFRRDSNMSKRQNSRKERIWQNVVR